MERALPHLQNIHNSVEQYPAMKKIQCCSMTRRWPSQRGRRLQTVISHKIVLAGGIGTVPGANGSPRRAAEAHRIVFRAVQHPAAQRLDARRDATAARAPDHNPHISSPAGEIAAGHFRIAMRPVGLRDPHFIRKCRSVETRTPGQSIRHLDHRHCGFPAAFLDRIRRKPICDLRFRESGATGTGNRKNATHISKLRG